jgi:uncharacterized membrane protein
MKIKTYKKIRAGVALFVAATVSVATTLDNRWLAVAGVLTGMIFLVLVRSKTKVTIDERERAVREKAAQWTYAIFTPVIGLGSFLMMTLASDNGFIFLQSLGIVLSYLTLFIICLYAVSYYFINRNLGGNEE